MKPEEYRRRWQAMLHAADANDDAEFWRLYAEWTVAADAISRERIALRKMARRLAAKLAVERQQELTL